MKTIQLTQGQVALVDDWKYEMVSKIKWHACGNGHGNFYAVGWDNSVKPRKRVKMHDLIMNPPKGMEVDHIFHNTLDNREQNLRICTKSQNNMNRLKRSGCSSKYKGVSWNKQLKKWFVSIKHKDKRIYLGLFKDEDDAARAYNKSATELFGSFANLNNVL